MQSCSMLPLLLILAFTSILHLSRALSLFPGFSNFIWGLLHYFQRHVRIPMRLFSAHFRILLTPRHAVTFALEELLPTTPSSRGPAQHP
jgi:hypothetical protein